MTRTLIAVWLAVGALVVTGCAGEISGDPTPAQPSVPTTKAVPSGLVAPTQINDTGRPEVEFDPCLDLSDDTMRQLGIDPKTRKRSDYVVTTYAFLACTFETDLNIVTISSSNITMKEFRDRYAGQVDDIDVYGREATIQRTELESCDIVMKTRDGVVDVRISLRSEARKRGMDKCDGLIELSQKVEPIIPPAN